MFSAGISTDEMCSASLPHCSVIFILCTLHEISCI